VREIIMTVLPSGHNIYTRS